MRVIWWRVAVVMLGAVLLACVVGVPIAWLLVRAGADSTAVTVICFLVGLMVGAVPPPLTVEWWMPWDGPS